MTLRYIPEEDTKLFGLVTTAIHDDNKELQQTSSAVFCC